MTKRISKQGLENRKEYFNNLCHKAYARYSPEILLKIINIIEEQDNRISLRFIEWFVTKYCNKIPIVLNGQNVYGQYKNKLKTHSKLFFDPFHRGLSVEFEFETVHKTVKSSYGQLLFFLWLIEDQILNYIDQNYDKLKLAMKEDNTNNKMRLKNKKQNNIKTLETKKSLPINYELEIKNGCVMATFG